MGKYPCIVKKEYISLDIGGNGDVRYEAEKGSDKRA
jgi:hypothetical protein